MLPHPTLLRAAACVCFTVASAAFANETHPVVLDEVEVNARRLPQPSSDVPQATTSFDPALLRDHDLDSLAKLAPLTPGLFVLEQNPASTSINFRGILSESTDPRQSPRVGLSFDGVSLGRPATAGLAFFDLGHVEILKGPQDSVFGRGAEGGLVVIESAKPSTLHEGRLTATVGELDHAALSGHVNTPLDARGHLAARVAFLRDTRDGYVENLAGGAALQSRDTTAIRPSIAWRPSENTSVELSLQYQHDEPTGTPFKSLVIPTSNGRLDTFGDTELNRTDQLGGDRDVLAASLRLDHEIAPGWTLTTQTGFVDFDAHEEFDGDGSLINLLELGESQTGEQLGQDLRLTRTWAERGHVHIGVHYFRERLDHRVRISTDEGQVWPFFSGRFRSALLSGGVPAGLVNTAVPAMSPFDRQTNLPAGFAAFGLIPSLASLAPLAGAPLNANYSERYAESAEMDSGELHAGGAFRPAPRLELSASARLVHEHQTLGYQSPFATTPSTLGFLLGGTPNLANPPTPGGAKRTASRSDIGWSARVGALYEVSPDWQVFASFARGRRPGTIVVSSTSETDVRSETVLAGEAGLRWISPTRRASAEAAVFRYHYTHFQTSQADPSNPSRNITRDAGGLTGQGAELTVRTLVGEHWELFGSYGYTDASFDAFGDDGRPQAYAGFTPRLTSRHTAALGATFRQTLDRHGELFITPLVQYRSAYYFENENDLFGGSLRQGGFTLLNLRAGWISPRKRWRVTAFVDNLLDKAWRLDAGNLGANYGIPTVIRAAPRHAGLETSFAW